MKKKTIEIDVYNYSELSEFAQTKAINNLLDFIIDLYPTEGCVFESIKKEVEEAIKKTDELKTPWFIKEYIWDYAEKELLKILNADEYLQDGNLFRESNYSYKTIL